MSYLAELKITFDKSNLDGEEEVHTKYVISSEKKEDFLKLLKSLTNKQISEDIE